MPEVYGPYAEVVVHGVVTGWRNWSNVFGVALGGEFDVIDQAAAEAIADQFLSAFSDNLGLFSNDWAITHATVQDKRAADKPQFVVDPGDNIVGTDTGDTLAPQLAMVISWRSALGGRSGRGRTYLNGLTESSNDGAGRIVSGSVNTGLALADDIIANTGAEGHPLAVVSKRHNKADRATAVVSEVTGRSVNDVFDTQRRRGRAPS